jgi:site-specific DNA-adenine methylase
MLPVLGEIISFHSINASKIADPFCGSAAVSWFLAETTDKEIVSGDIQSFAVARARSVVERTGVLDPDSILKPWFAKARKVVDSVASHFPNHLKSIEPDLTDPALIFTALSNSRSCR